MKFKIGDKVRVKFSDCGAPEYTVGKEGVVVEVGEDGDHFGVKFDKAYDYYNLWWYTDDELEVCDVAV